MSSTKQQIVDSAQELIGNLEDKLDTTSRLHIEREEERKGKINRAYQAVLGRDPTEDEMTNTLGYFGSDPDYSAQTLRGDLQIGNEYREKFNKSYQDSYFDSMYGESWNETFTDDQGEERSKQVRNSRLNK